MSAINSRIATAGETPDLSPGADFRRISWARRLLGIGDLVAIAASFAVTVALLGDSAGLQFALGLALAPVWVVVFKIYRLYDRDANRISHSTVDDIPSLFHAVLVGVVMFFVLSRFLGHEDKATLREGLTLFAVSFVAITSTRAVARKLALLILPAQRVLVVGGGPNGALLVRKMRQHDEYGLTPIGYLSQTRGSYDDESLPYLGEISNLEAVCEREHVDRVVIAAPDTEHVDLEALVRQTAGLNVRISLLPHVGDVLGPSVEVDDIEGVTVLGINPPTLARSSRILKRTMDLVISSLALLAVLPTLIAIAIAIRVTSPGPVLYRQERVGRGGKRFRILKFRTMTEDAEAQVNELRERSAHPVWLLLDHDPRITRIGALLRRGSLDELPQLWNVVRGDMSLVGPRPMLPEIDEQILGWQRRRLDLTPGLTGLWQALGRTSISFEEMLKLDYLYVTNWSMWQDVRLLLRTVPTVLKRRGAN